MIMTKLDSFSFSFFFNRENFYRVLPGLRGGDDDNDDAMLMTLMMVIIATMTTMTMKMMMMMSLSVRFDGRLGQMKREKLGKKT